MNLSTMTKKNLILLDLDVSSKEDAIKKMVEALYKDGAVSSKEEFFNEVMKRESISPTGLENGFAVPHGKSDCVKRAAFVMARLNKKLEDWESIQEDNKVDLVFLIAIPTNEAGSTHLKVLSELSVSLMDNNFVNTLRSGKTVEDIMKVLETGKKEKVTNVKNTGDVVLAITACATGIAHTYMSAEALEQAGRELGVTVLVEKQGANGIEDKHTAENIKKAKGIILATDIAPKDVERFAGMPYIKTKVADPLKNAKELIQKVLNNPEGKVEAGEDAVQTSSKSSKGGLFAEMSQAVMTGISYMIPVIVAAGVVMGIAKLAAMQMGIVDTLGAVENATNPNQLIVILHHLDKFGGMILKFMYPIFSAYVAYSIADRPGLLSGILGGAFAGGLHFTFWGVDGGIPSGFIGALILGLLAGYTSKFLNEKIKLTKNLQAMKPMFIIPAVSVLVVFFVNFYIVDPVFGGLNLWLQNFIGSFSTGSTLILTAVIAAATAFDLGGPVNKAAGAIAMGLAADGIFPLTGRVLSIIIPPIGLGLATILDKYVVRRRVFDANLRTVGNTSLLLGFIAISEGAIPFMLRNPLITIPVNIIGAILGSVTAVALGAVQWNPLPAVWGWPLVENLWAYLLGLVVGVMFIALANIFIRAAILKKQENN